MATQKKTKSEKKTETKSGVPEGSVDDVKAWVGDDSERAKAALEAEKAKSEDDQRETLIEPLENMLGIGDNGDGDGDDDGKGEVFETTRSEPADKGGPSPVASSVTTEDQQAGDDTVLLEEELLAFSLPRRGSRMLKTVAGHKGQRISKARKEQIEERNAEVEAEAAKRAKVMDVRSSGSDEE